MPRRVRRLFAGDAADADIAALLTGLRDKGETAVEVEGAARSMRAHMVGIDSPPGAIDIVGTGGDGLDTLNVSTAAALVVAACGVPVAKHGNRAASSRAGSSDVLAALGVALKPPLAVLDRCLAQAGICFLYAPRHHPAMQHVARVRRALGTRTIFNLLGPLTNPASVRRHVVGVYDARLLASVTNVSSGAVHRLSQTFLWYAAWQQGGQNSGQACATHSLRAFAASVQP